MSPREYANGSTPLKSNKCLRFVMIWVFVLPKIYVLKGCFLLAKKKNPYIGINDEFFNCCLDLTDYEYLRLLFLDEKNITGINYPSAHCDSRNRQIFFKKSRCRWRDFRSQ